jgi:hypothetical protein
MGWTPGFRFPTGARNISVHCRSRTDTEVHPVKGYRGSFLEGKAAGREVDDSSLSSAEVKNCEVYLDSSIRLNDAVLN